MKQLAQAALVVGIMALIPHYVRCVYRTPTRWGWEPCDRYGRRLALDHDRQDGRGR